MHGFQNSRQQKNSNNNEESHKILTTRCFFFKKKDVKIAKEEALTHRKTQQVKHRGKTLKRAILESLLAKRGLALCFQGQGEL
jgi:hypothetical protein